MGQTVNLCRSLVRKDHAKSSFEKLLSRKQDNIKIVVQEHILENEPNWLRLGSNVGFCKHDNEPSDYINLSSSVIISFLREFCGAIMDNSKESKRNFSDMARTAQGRSIQQKRKLQ